MRDIVTRYLNRVWYGGAQSGWWLQPLARLFEWQVNKRRARFRQDAEAVHKLPVPVIVVGNISVGGTGKTPVVIWLTSLLQDAGMSPAVVSRGYGGTQSTRPRLVEPDSLAQEVGDEPVLIAQKTRCPVWVDRDRVRASEAAVAAGADVVIADDGLQHYRLGRDLEIAVVDAERRFGNGRLLPAGPLREPLDRLHEVDLTLWHCQDLGAARDTDKLVFTLRGDTLTSLRTGEQQAFPIANHAGPSWVAMAAIGHPQRFFTSLSERGLIFEPVALADHAKTADYPFARYPGQRFVVTEKDAVKLGSVDADIWVANVELCMPEKQKEMLESDLGKRLTGLRAAREHG